MQVNKLSWRIHAGERDGKFCAYDIYTVPSSLSIQFFVRYGSLKHISHCFQRIWEWTWFLSSFRELHRRRARPCWYPWSLFWEQKSAFSSKKPYISLKCLSDKDIMIEQKQFSDIERLSTFLDSPTASTYTTRVFFLSQSNSWSRISITPGMLRCITSHHGITPLFFQTIQSFKKRVRQTEDAYCSPIRLKHGENVFGQTPHCILKLCWLSSRDMLRLQVCWIERWKLRIPMGC